MPFTEGHNLSKGRPLGARDRIGTKTRELFKNLVNENLEQLRDDLKTLKPYQRIDAIIKMANFILPKLQSIQMYEANTIEELLLMTPEERKRELIRLKNEIAEKNTTDQRA